MPLGFLIQDQFLRFFVFGDAGYNSMTFNFDTNVAQVESLAPMLNATDPDLSAFRAGGGKLLIWHGWADHSVTPDRTIEYYNSVIRAMGNRNRVEGFLRLFKSLSASHVGPGVARTRPLCSYPKVAVYDGSGDINDASNLRCKQRGLGFALGGRDSN